MVVVVDCVVVFVVVIVKFAPAAGREVFYGGMGLHELQVGSYWYRRSYQIN